MPRPKKHVETEEPKEKSPPKVDLSKIGLRKKTRLESQEVVVGKTDLGKNIVQIKDVPVEYEVLSPEINKDELGLLVKSGEIDPGQFKDYTPKVGMLTIDWNGRRILAKKQDVEALGFKNE